MNKQRWIWNRISKLLIINNGTVNTVKDVQIKHDEIPWLYQETIVENFIEATDISFWTNLQNSIFILQETLLC